MKQHMHNSFVLFCLSVILLSPRLHAAQRVISTGGSVTEIIYALGQQAQLVAVDESSLYPTPARELPSVGYYRNLSAEGVLSLQPDVLIAGHGSGPDEVLAQVQSSGVDVLRLPKAQQSLADWQALVQRLGEFFGAQQQAAELIDRTLAQLRKNPTSKAPRRAMLLMGTGQRGVMAAGQGTVPHLLFGLAGLDNVAADIEGYKIFNNESLIQSGVELLVIPEHVLHGIGGIEGVCNNSTIRLALNGQRCDTLVMDSLLILGLGARIDQAVAQLQNHGH